MQPMNNECLSLKTFQRVVSYVSQIIVNNFFVDLLNVLLDVPSAVR